MRIRDLFDHGSGTEIFGFEINIPDPQHWFQLFRKIIRCLGIWSWPWVAPIYGVSSSSVYHNKTDGMTLLAGRKLLLFLVVTGSKTHDGRRTEQLGPSLHPRSNKSIHLEVLPVFAYKWTRWAKATSMQQFLLGYFPGQATDFALIASLFISQSDSGRI